MTGWILLAMLAQPTGGEPLACNNNPTYFPGSRHWPAHPEFFYGYQQAAPGAPSIPTDAEFETVRRVFSKWTEASCPEGGMPNLDFRDLLEFNGTPNPPNRDGGELNQNVLFFAIDSEVSNLDSLTLATTSSVFEGDTGIMLGADIEFNHINYEWRTRDDSGTLHGCAGPTDPSVCSSGTGQGCDCFDFETVALHEVGHLMGFDHVDCSDAVMFPSASPSSELIELSINELTGVCTIYRPRDAGLTAEQRDRGEFCASVSQCALGENICLKPLGFGATDEVGYCTSTCITTDDCAAGFACGELVDGMTTTRFCRPGVNQTGATTGGNGGTPVVDPGTGEPVDLCEPCNNGSQCSSGVCVSNGAGTSICTRACSTTATSDTCPGGFSCVATNASPACFPDDPSNCGSSIERKTLNEECYSVDSSFSSANATYNACAPDLVCVAFKPTCEGQRGACVYYCNESSPCPDANLTCCAGVNDDGVCQPITSENPDGGCFDIRRTGESCVSAEQSICESGSTCANFGDPSQSRCFQSCAAQSCGSGLTCIAPTDGCGVTSALCCEEQALNSGQCNPIGTETLLELGAECAENDDCQSDFCLKLDGESACSRTCNPVTNIGCPGNTDIDGDGVFDGGFTCRALADGRGRCWPVNGPVGDSEPSTPETPESGDGCNSGRGQTSGQLASLLLLGWVVRRRRRPAV